ncbi:MAG: alpha/beta hydrolase [Planctomycetes bacterium]|nr:alpha/beta hydrolase [Planctomycetota bacterium]
MTKLLTFTYKLIALSCIINISQIAQASDKSSSPLSIRELTDIGYFEGVGKDTAKHKLDLFLPPNPENAPVFFFVHGGAWVQGDKNFFGIYSAIGRLAAQNGMIGVVISYRLTPKVKHPSHAEDVARAIAWTTKNIKKYGGDPERIILCGHSAGGHLVSLVSCDPNYLKTEKVNPSSIKGVISISGVYEIPKILLGNVFGNDPEKKIKASPITHVRKDLPPFLILCADKELPLCTSADCKKFQKALEENGNPVKFHEISPSNHMKMVFDAGKPEKQVATLILQFARQVLKPTPTP